MTDTSKTAAPADSTLAISSLSFEAVMGELEPSAEARKRRRSASEESVALYERGHALRGHLRGTARRGAGAYRAGQRAGARAAGRAGTTPFGES